MYIKVTGLYIGQGMSNLVEVYENKADATAANPVFKGLVLIDCGTFGKDGKPGPARNEPDRPIALDYIERKIRQNKGTLTALILSHLDQDHINKIIRLTGENKDGPLQKIGIVLIGGTAKQFDVKKNVFSGNSGVAGLSAIARNMAAALKKICTNIRIFSITDGYVQKDCNFLKFQGTTAPHKDELQFRLLANRSLPALKASDDLYINGNSAVLIAEYVHPQGAHFAFLFTGDATEDTFAYMNKRLDEFRTKYTFLNATKKVLMLPHHGAVRTACHGGKMTSNSTLEDQLAQAIDFADTVEATHVFASAHYNARRFSHPNMDVFDIFSNHAEGDAAHENFGFQVRIDSAGVPVSGQPNRFSPSYGLLTTDSAQAAYTAHTILTPTQPPAPPFSKPLVSYTSTKGGAFHIDDLPTENHQFYSLVSEVDNGAFSSGIQAVL